MQRLTALSQIILCVLAVFGLFYTVIPLYKSALLEEEIARKTRRLETTENALRQTYRHLRDQRVRLYLSNLDAKCNASSAFPMLKNATIIAAAPQQWKDPVLVNSFTSCVKDFGSDGLQDLSVDDRELLVAEVARTAQEMEPLRLRAVEDIKGVAGLAATNPALLVPADPRVQRYVDEMRKAQPEAAARVELTDREMRTRDQLLVKHQDSVRDHLFALRNLAWPSEALQTE